MKARRIGNGKGVDAIENVVNATNKATDGMDALIENTDEYGRINPNFSVDRVVVNAGLAHDTIEQFFADIASGVIDDGDIMDYIIESKAYKFMDELERLSAKFAALVSRAVNGEEFE